MNTPSMVISQISSFGAKARIVSSRGTLAVVTAMTLFACSVEETGTDRERLRADDSENDVCGCDPPPGDTGSASTGAGQTASATVSVGAGGANGGSGATTGAGAGGASSGSSGGVSCIHDVDCPANASECSRWKCVMGTCSQSNMSAGTPAQSQVSGDCHRRACDGGGNMINVIDDTDAPPSSGACSASSCKLGAVVNTWAAEGSSCSGGVCNKSGACVECVCDADCGGGTCNASGHCVAPSCTDGVKNGSECDVDCGQGCKACGSGRSCSRGSDCTLGVCLTLLGAKIGVCL